MLRLVLLHVVSVFLWHSRITADHFLSGGCQVFCPSGSSGPRYFAPRVHRGHQQRLALFANQLVGSATSVAKLVHICNNFYTSRLATQGYNVTLIKDRIYTSSQLPALESDATIQNLTILYSTDIWVLSGVSPERRSEEIIAAFQQIE